MQDLVFFDVQGFYPVKISSRKSEWRDWMRGVPLEAALNLVKRGNNQTKGLRVVEVKYTVIDTKPKNGLRDHKFIVQGKYPLNEDGTRLGSTREWHNWIVDCSYSKALKYVEGGNDLTTGLRIVTVSKEVIQTYDKDGVEIDV